MPSEVAKVFEELPSLFQKGAVKAPRTFYFSLDDDEKWTVSLTKDKCKVTAGKPASRRRLLLQGQQADVPRRLERQAHARPPTDFLMGSIKSNNPLLLKEFVDAFKKK